MSILHALQGAPTLLIVCVLLFAEESGVPIPAPGEAVLIGAGLFVAGGGAPLWVALPAVFGAVCAGALAGYGWSRAIGFGRLRGLAVRLRFEGPFDRVSGRLRAAGVRDVAASRLIPGLRVYTTLVAGGVAMPFRRFVAAVLPAAALWVVVFSLVGVFVGVPAERLLGRAEGVGLRIGAALAIVAAGYVLIRRVPDSRPAAPGLRAGRPRALAAFAIDCVAVVLVVLVLDILTGLEVGDLATPIASAIVLTALAVIYLLIARRSIGQSLGEVVMRTRYGLRGSDRPAV